MFDTTTFTSASGRFTTDEVAPLLSGGEQDLGLSAVPQGCGLCHGCRFRGCFHNDLRKRGDDNVRRHYVLGCTVGWISLIVSRLLEHKDRKISDKQIQPFVARRRRNAPISLFNWRVEKAQNAGGVRPFLPHCSGNAMATSAWVVCCDDLYVTLVKLAVTHCSRRNYKTGNDQSCQGGNKATET